MAETIRKTNAHRVELAFDDGSVYVKLICPGVDGTCEPVGQCGECYRMRGDVEAPRCDVCPADDDTGCWLAGWDDLATYLTGKIIVTVDVEHDGDGPVLEIVSGEER